MSFGNPPPSSARTPGKSNTPRGRAAQHFTRAVGVVDALVEWSQLTRMAAAMSYRTIFGLIPVLVIGLVVLGAFATQAQVGDVISLVLKHAGINQIVVEEQSHETAVGRPELTSVGGMPVFYTPPPAPEEELTPQEELLGMGAVTDGNNPTHSARLDEWINALVQRVRSIPFTAIGLVGVAALIYAAISMLAEVEGSFNQIYRVTDGRSWVRRVPLYWSLLTLGSLLLVASFFVGERLTNWVEHLSALQALSEWRGNVIRAVAFAVTVAISTLLLLLVYMTVPNTRVKLWPALAGAFFGAVLWETGKWGFTRYVHYSASYSRLYGSIALIPLFLMWVYVTWIVVLFGLRLCYLLQYGRQAFTPGNVLHSLLALPATAQGVASAPLVDPTAMVAVMADAAARFKEGKPAFADDIARTTKLNSGVVSTLLDRLALAGLLHRVDIGDAGVRYTLTRPAETIQASDLVRLGHETVDPPDSPASGYVAKMRDAQRGAVEGLTLADLMATGPARTSGGRDTPPPSGAAAASTTPTAPGATPTPARA